MTRSRRSSSQLPLAVRILRVTLAAFPGRFRRRYAAEMIGVFAERYATERARHGRWAAAVLWIRTCRNLLSSAALEHIRDMRRPAVPTHGALKGPADHPTNGHTREHMINSILMDLNYAVRGLLKKPGFTLVAVTTLSLGVGASTAIFSIVNEVLLRPLPYDRPEELVRIWSHNPAEGREQYFTSPLSFYNWREDLGALDGIAAAWPREVTLTDDDNAAVRLKTMTTTANWFAVLGSHPVLGRTFMPEEGVFGEPQVVVLSYGVWQDRYGGDPDIVGRTVYIEGESGQVIGVLPRGTEFPETADLWTVFAPPPTQGAQYMDVIGRLASGHTIAGGRAELETIARAVAEEFPELAGWGIEMAPLRDVVVGDVRSALWILLGATGLVLAIACANVANLLLARTEARHREIAVRAALGAGRGRLVRQLLTESLVLASMGTAAGLLVAIVGQRALLALAPATLPRFDGVSLNGPVLLVALLSAVFTGIAFGLAPAVQLLRVNLQSDLKEGNQRVSGASGHRLRSGFVVTQLALAVMVTTGAGLLIKSFNRLRDTDPGFDPTGLLTLEVNLPATSYETLATVIDTYDRLQTRIEGLPGVESSGITSSLPLSDPLDYLLSLVVVGAPPPEPGQGPAAWYRQVSPGFFATMGIPLIRGRPFDATDRPESPGVVIINRALARLLFETSVDPIGQHLSGVSGSWGPLGRVINAETEIVGIVDDVRYGSLRASAVPSIYFPHAQAPFRRMTVAVRTAGDPAGHLPAIRNEIALLDPNLPLGNVMTMQRAVERSIARDRFSMFLVSLFGGVALVLAAVGIYGVLSYTVAQRTNELGIRMALGASGKNVLGLVMLQSTGLIALGIGSGVVGALLATRVMASQLYGVTARDPVTFVGVALLLGLVALLSSYLPALRATKVDPLTALRYN
ncbi:MAG: ABC transporter permease [Gemmatimonadetes bacterium]|nr:ABC transporter permease [Gemmatimonadota bacterium]